MASPESTTPKRSAIYLSTPVNALVEGLYEQTVSLSEIKTHGDFGLGTFNELDGEMVLLDGDVYQVNSKGEVIPVPDETLTPFACVTFFRSLSHDLIDRELDYPGFLAMVGKLLPSPNLFYAIRVEGTFAHVKTRSVPKQENYRPLVEVAREQPEFEFHDTRGTLAGFYTPSFMSSLNVPGLHLHFLSEDLTHGGHLLECRPTEARVDVQFLTRLELSLPMSLDYLTWDLSRDVNKDLHKAER